MGFTLTVSEKTNRKISLLQRVFGQDSLDELISSLCDAQIKNLVGEQNWVTCKNPNHSLGADGDEAFKELIAYLEDGTL